MDKTEKVEKVWAVITVARQVEGEYIFIKTEKVFLKAREADAHMSKLKTEYITLDGKQKPVSLSTPQGDADCMCTVGAFELEVEGDLWKMIEAKE